ncbi:DUF3304 domain-containing protein [Paraburkholderia bannensis]|uniref:DUF3304 domain-containing protein n=2 Tax=Paraburkholderia bannensis TaxID=765414 RepID=UPI0005A7FBA7|nr:DUF3304 domain-containing protein [Paraburkholderia bannensis]
MILDVTPIRRIGRWIAMLSFALVAAACSRADDANAQAAARVVTPASAVADGDALDLNINALNYTDVPIDRFYVNDVLGGVVRSRLHSSGIGTRCCVRLPARWHAGLTVTVEWRDALMYRKDPASTVSRVVPVEPYDFNSDGYVWVLFMPDDKIKVYASSWMPGFAGFPEGLQPPDRACPGHFTLLNSDPRCPAPDQGIKP